MPPELARLPWPPAEDDVRAFEDGVPIAGGTAYGVAIPTTFPRVFVAAGLDLLALERAWGTLSRDHAQYAVWWNPAAKLRARHDVPHPTPSRGRGLELAPYVSTIDRIANIDELLLDVAAGTIHVPPGEWDPVPVAVVVTASPRRARFTVRVDGPPVDEAAVLAKLREIYGEPTGGDGLWTYAGGRLTARRVETVPAVELVYLTP